MKTIVKGTAVAAAVLGAALLAPPLAVRAQSAAGASGYKLLREVPIAGETGWDYLTADSEARRLYLTSNSGAIVFDMDAEKVIGNIPGKPFTHGVGFVHGVAVAPEFNRGFLSHEVPPSVIIFDLKTLAEIGVTPTDPGTDAVLYDPVSKRIFTFNGKKAGVHDATVIDAATGKPAGTIPLPGVPEFPAADGAGRIYVNIASKSELAEIDSQTMKVVATWPMAPCQEPSGLAMDTVHRRLFAGCDNKMMAMIDADTGKVLGTVPIGDGVDANGFDPGTGYAFASCGDGTLTVAHEDSPDKMTLVEHIKTAPSARTMAIDLKTHRVYLLAAKFETTRPAASADNPHRYPEIVPGTARLLILGR